MLVIWPEGLVELEEDLRVRAECEGGDGGLFPFWELRLEGDDVVLEDAERYGGNGIVGVYTGAVGCEDLYTSVRISDVCYYRVEKKARVVGLEELGGLVLEPCVEATGVSANYATVSFPVQ